MGAKRRTEPDQFSHSGAHEGVCRGCGQPTYYRRRGIGDTINWHRRCYQRLYRRRTRGSFAPEQKTCAVCGKVFVVQGHGFARKTCSPACSEVRSQDKKYKGVKFSQVLREGVCLGCGGRTRKRRGEVRKDSFNWHRQCYRRVRGLPAPVRSKLVSIHREFADWLSAWQKQTKPGAGFESRAKA